MTSVLIRDVPDDELEVLRAAAAASGKSLQAYLLETLHARTLHARREVVLRDISERLQCQPPVPESSRQAVLDAIGEAHEGRTAELSGDR